MKSIKNAVAGAILVGLATTANAQVALIANLAGELSSTLNSTPIGQLPLLNDLINNTGSVAVSQLTTTLLPVLVDLPGANLLVGPIVPLGTQFIGVVSPLLNTLPITELPGLSSLPGGL